MAKKRATKQRRTSKKKPFIKKSARRKARTPEEKAEEQIAVKEPVKGLFPMVGGRHLRVPTLR